MMAVASRPLRQLRCHLPRCTGEELNLIALAKFLPREAEEGDHEVVEGA